MRRLREMLPQGRRMKQVDVLDGAVELIQNLEAQLLARLREVGVPSRLSSSICLQEGPINIEAIRRAVGEMMAK